jgi:hypothetical protein
MSSSSNVPIACRSARDPGSLPPTTIRMDLLMPSSRRHHLRSHPDHVNGPVHSNVLAQKSGSVPMSLSAASAAAPIRLIFREAGVSANNAEYRDMLGPTSGTDRTFNAPDLLTSAPLGRANQRYRIAHSSTCPHACHLEVHSRPSGYPRRRSRVFQQCVG